MCLLSHVTLVRGLVAILVYTTDNATIAPSHMTHDMHPPPHMYTTDNATIAPSHMTHDMHPPPHMYTTDTATIAPSHMTHDMHPPPHMYTTDNATIARGRAGFRNLQRNSPNGNTIHRTSRQQANFPLDLELRSRPLYWAQRFGRL
jgi:hypothetical protein